MTCPCQWHLPLPMNRPPTCGVTSSPHEGRVGRGPRRGESKVNAPPLPSPLLLPASGGEGENSALRFRGSRREYVRGILSPRRRSGVGGQRALPLNKGG